jgi:hypothetical protein
LYKQLVTLFLLQSLAGCVKSPGGSSGELVVISPPTFSGDLYKAFTTPSTAFILNATCDLKSTGIQYSYDNSSWTDFAGGCPPTAQISLNVNVFSTLDVYLRSVTISGYTKSSHAYIRLLLPPTSPFFQTASSGAAENDSSLNKQTSMDTTFSKETLTNGIINLKTSLIDMIYE